MTCRVQAEVSDMCTTTKNDFYCKIEMRSAIVSSGGAIIQEKYPHKFYSFSHDSMSGCPHATQTSLRANLRKVMPMRTVKWTEHGKSAEDRYITTGGHLSSVENALG